MIRDLRSVATAGYRENIRAIVFRDIETHSYGFSVSDGLLDKGVFIHSIKPDGPANRAGIQPYDKILQINNTRYDCFFFLVETSSLLVDFSKGYWHGSDFSGNFQSFLSS